MNNNATNSDHNYNTSLRNRKMIGSDYDKEEFMGLGGFEARYVYMYMYWVRIMN
jgi:hypothetical protein